MTYIRTSPLAASAARYWRGARLLGLGGCLWLIGCDGPVSPSPIPPPPEPTPVTAPVIRSITVPAQRVEANQSVTVGGVVEVGSARESLDYRWTASAGSITGQGASAIWTMPGGLVRGVDVTVTLAVAYRYDSVENGRLVTRESVVSRTSDAFRVHDSTAESKELARKFLIDLFGNSSVAPDDCLVDFSDICADWDYGRNDERDDIVEHRSAFIVHRATMLAQRLEWHTADFATVHNAVLYDDQEIGKPPKAPTCGDFYVTVIYHAGRWWLCQSRWNPNDLSGCPPHLSNTQMKRLRERGQP